MICQICNINEATIHLTEIINNQVVELHICETCAKSKSLDVGPPMPFSDILAGLVDFTSKKDDDDEVLRCDGCGISYEEFRKKGRLGCQKCYDSFKVVLLPLIKRVQGATHNMGKMPGSLSGNMKLEMEIKELELKLKNHIQAEEFEEAAQLRDKIKMLRAKQDG